jgi:hypothetical protein
MVMTITTNSGSNCCNAKGLEELLVDDVRALQTKQELREKKLEELRIDQTGGRGT